MEVSVVRRRLAAATERARRNAQERRQRAADAQQAYEAFLTNVATPLVRTLANVLKAEGYLFTLATPGGSLRLSSEKGRDDVIEIALDTSADPPVVVGRVSRARGSRTIADERPVKPGAGPDQISEDDLLDFLLATLEPWLER